MGTLDFEFEKFLGKGSYGSVSLFRYKGQCDGGTFYIAVKTSDDKHSDSLKKEFEILSELKGCSRIIQCYGKEVKKVCNHEGNVEYKFPMEYAPGGSLRSFMDRFKDGKLPEPMIKKFTRMILEGLATIHRHGYVHCDLKPENILVFPSCVYENGAWRRDYELKISDFGLTKREGDVTWWHSLRPYAGTPIYMSSESISRGEIGKGLDIWSLGCVVLEMYTGKKPWWHKNYDLTDLMNLEEPQIPADLDLDAKFFLKTCFDFEPDMRGDAMTLLKDRFLLGDVTKSQVDVKKIDRIKQFELGLNKLREKLLEIKMMGLN